MGLDCTVNAMDSFHDQRRLVICVGTERAYNVLKTIRSLASRASTVFVGAPVCTFILGAHWAHFPSGSDLNSIEG